MPDKLSIDDLAPAPYNPREITDAAADGLRASVARFGDIGGITYNARTKRLVCGHQRVKQLRALGAQMVDGALQLASGHRFPVRVVDWTEAEEKAANVEANNRHIAGTFNADLDGLLGELRGSMGEVEFQELRLDELLSEQPDAMGEVEQDEVPEPPAEPVCKAGDVWVLGEHLLVCGDCRTVAFAPHDIMFTSPPYNAASHLDWGNKGNRKLYAHYADNMPAGDWVSMVVSVIEQSSSMAAWAFVNLSYSANQRSAWVDVPAANRQYLWETIIWDKGTALPVPHGLTRVCEFIFVFRFSKQAGHVSKTFETAHNVWRIRSSGVQGKEHAATFPVELPAAAIDLVDAQSVLDPFAGSGTTLIAAEQLGRKCHAIEIEPRYCDVIIERWEQLTGGKAQRKAG